MKKNQIEAMQDAINTAGQLSGIKAKIWKEKRIYIAGFGKDIGAYIDFDEPDSTDYNYLFQGCALHVFSNCAQSRAWLINRSKKVKHEIATFLFENNITNAGPIENWQEMIAG